MKKLLNTLYITKENAYIALEGNNVVIKEDNAIIGRFPLHILEGIIAFNYMGCSPALIKACNENNIMLSFLDPNGRYCGRFVGKTNGNILVRRAQYNVDEQLQLQFCKHIIYAKGYNSKQILLRFLRDHKKVDKEKRIRKVIDGISTHVEEVINADNIDTVRGLEGMIARKYFSVFDVLIRKQKDIFYFNKRSKRPPMDRVNALLSFFYTILSLDIQSALESNGIDSFAGWMHVDRPGRAGMALDMMEEMRTYLVDRGVLNLINLGIVTEKHFDIKVTDATLLNEKGRKLVLEYWQKRKHKEITHPYLNMKIKLGLLPHVQALLLNRHIRGDLEAYPPFLLRG